jgi:hypothetical protein
VIDVESAQGKVRNCQILVSQSGDVVYSGVSDENGNLTVHYDFILNEEYVVSALADGYAVGRHSFTPSLATDVEDNGQLPSEFMLAQNYPNPFNPTTTIQFDLASKSKVTLEVYNVLGQSIRTLVNGILGAGNHTVIWNATDNNGDRVSSGVYFYRLNTETNKAVRKMLLIK